MGLGDQPARKTAEQSPRPKANGLDWASRASAAAGRRMDRGQAKAGGPCPNRPPPTPIFADWVPCGRVSPQPHKKLNPDALRDRFSTFSLQAVDSLHGARDCWDSTDLPGYPERPCARDCWDSTDLPGYPERPCARDCWDSTDLPGYLCFSHVLTSSLVVIHRLTVISSGGVLLKHRQRERGVTCAVDFCRQSLPIG